MGAIILDGYSRAYVLNWRNAAHCRAVPPARAGAAQQDRSGSMSAGPLSVAMTISERRDLQEGFALSRLGISRKTRGNRGSSLARPLPG
jgi:hypothetical protein